MPGKKKKIYHQKFGATYSYTKQITYTLPHPHPQMPQTSAGWPLSEHKTENK